METVASEQGEKSSSPHSDLGSSSSLNDEGVASISLSDSRQSAEVAADSLTRERYVATADHVGKDGEELSFLVGETVWVIEKPSTDRWLGECHENQGFFPASKVKLAEGEEPVADAKDDVKAESKASQRFKRMSILIKSTKVNPAHPELVVPAECVADDTYLKTGFQQLEAAPKIPLLVLVNPGSGGQRGEKIISAYKNMINPAQVFDIVKSDGPAAPYDTFFSVYTPVLPLFARSLKLFSVFPQFRVLVCGGDGTVAWVLQEVHALGLNDKALVAVMPLGTGNDLARVLGWGPGYEGKMFGTYLSRVAFAPVMKLDRWRITVEYHTGSPEVLYVNNYFSIGMSAKLAFKFHEARQKNPERFKSRTKNKVLYIAHFIAWWLTTGR